MAQGIPVVIAALIAAFIAVFATNAQLRNAEQGQITDRYNAAITNLGSKSIEVRLGGIYALQRLMQDSTRDQPTVVAVLCAFVRDRSASPAKPPTLTYQQPTDIQAALTVVGTRDTASDGKTTVIDLERAHLASALLDHGHLAHADFTRADLRNAVLTAANLSYATFVNTEAFGARLYRANLMHAVLFNADLQVASLRGADLRGADLNSANLIGAKLRDADLRGAKNLDRAILYDAHLTGAIWPSNVKPPAGWQRSTSGRLERTS